MVNYQNAKIYKIVNDELNLTYYGSTCSTLTKRLSGHKSDSKKKNVNYSSKILFSTETKPEIFLVEKFPCNDKIELLKRERFYIENNNCLNKHIPGRSINEWIENHKEEKIKYDKERYLKNKEKTIKQNTEYVSKNKDKVKEYKRQYYLKQKLLKSQSN